MARSSEHLRRARTFSEAEDVLAIDLTKPAVAGHARGAEHVEGTVKEAIGTSTGDGRVEAEGRARKRRARSPKAATRED